MVNVNIVYDCDYNDADIISVPAEIVNRIEEIGQEFLDWDFDPNDDDYWAIVNGKKYPATNTKGFIKWLNNTYCKDIEKAYLVKENVPYDPKLRIIEF